MLPAFGSVSLSRSRISVDLPEPVDPTRNTNSPRRTLKLASRRATSPPSYFLVTPRNSTTAGAWARADAMTRGSTSKVAIERRSVRGCLCAARNGFCRRALLGGHTAPRDRRGLDDRRRRLPVQREAVDDLLQVRDVAHVGGHHEAVLARDAAAVDDLLGALRQLGDLGQLARRGAHADDRAQRVAERPRVDERAVAGDDAGVLEAAHAVARGRRRQADAAAQLGEAHATVRLELGEHRAIDGIEAVRPLIRRHV